MLKLCLTLGLLTCDVVIILFTVKLWSWLMSFQFLRYNRQRRTDLDKSKFTANSGHFFFTSQNQRITKTVSSCQILLTPCSWCSPIFLSFHCAKNLYSLKVHWYWDYHPIASILPVLLPGGSFCGARMLSGGKLFCHWDTMDESAERCKVHYFCTELSQY